VVDYLVESEAWAVAGRQRGYTLQVVRQVRCILRLNVSNVLDSLTTAGNLFQMVSAEKLKERLLKLVVQEGIHKRFWLAEQRQRGGWYMCRRFLRYGGWLVKSTILYCICIVLRVFECRKPLSILYSHSSKNVVMFPLEQTHDVGVQRQ